MLRLLVLPSYSPPTSPKDVISLLPPPLNRQTSVFSVLSAPLSHSHLNDGIDLRKDSAKIFAFGHGGIILSPARAESAEDGSSRTTGYLQVVSTTRRMVKKIVIRIVARQSIAFPQDLGVREHDEVYSKVVEVGRGDELEGGGRGILLDQGVNTFEYSIQIPSTTCCRVSTPYSRIDHFVCGTVVGSARSVFGKDLQAEEEIMVMSAPPSFSSDADVECFGLDIRAENHTPKLGPFSLNVASSRFIVGGPLFVSLSIFSPPPNLAIYSVVVYLDQEAHLTSFKNPNKRAVVHSKLMIIEASASGSSKPLNTGRPLKKGTRAMMECRGESEDTSWSYEKVARMPTDRLLQPTTHCSTDTSIRFTSELIVKIYYTSFDPMDPNSSTTLLRATLLKRQVSIGCCGCLKTRLSLPNYSEDPSSSVCSLAMNSPSCQCKEPWLPMLKTELDLFSSLSSSSSPPLSSLSSPPFSSPETPGSPAAAAAAEESMPRRRELTLSEEQARYLIPRTRKIGESYFPAVERGLGGPGGGVE